MRVLVAGANGALGSSIVGVLRSRGHYVRALTRRATTGAVADELAIADALAPDDALAAAFEGVDAVVSALGASVALTLRGRATYAAVDIPANGNLVRAAERAGVARFVYLGVHPEAGYAHTRYVRAHTAVEELLSTSKIDATTIRPVGVFTALTDFFRMAQRGQGQLLGDGTARTNPIHPQDVAEAVAAHLESGPPTVSVGGPDILTRREILELAFAAVGRPARIRHTPPGMVRAMVPMMRLFHPRLGDLTEFAVEVSTHDAVAPVAGSRRLADYFASLTAPAPAELPA